jgi:hypothetical protein
VGAVICVSILVAMLVACQIEVLNNVQERYSAEET